MKELVPWVLLLLFVATFVFNFLFLQLLRERHPGLYKEFGSPTVGGRAREMSPNFWVNLRFQQFIWGGDLFKLDRYMWTYAVAHQACGLAFMVLLMAFLGGAFDGGGSR